jgi:hypothetical protein
MFCVELMSESLAVFSTETVEGLDRTNDRRTCPAAVGDM